MEIEVPTEASTGFDKNLRNKARSAGRMRYDAEVAFLKRQNGDLEQIRQKLGLSRRKICQLLLVDPSAWTRWTTSGRDAPPHVYQALDWYLSILEKDPEYRRLAKRFTDWLNVEKQHEARLLRLESSTLKTTRADWRLIVGACLVFAAGFVLAFFLRRPA